MYMIVQALSLSLPPSLSPSLSLSLSLSTCVSWQQDDRLLLYSVVNRRLTGATVIPPSLKEEV